MKMPNITILWGQCPEPHQEPITYEYKTQAELDAFCHGVDEMDGWLGYEIIYTEEEMKQEEDEDDRD
jgi:hypothetical protein